MELPWQGKPPRRKTTWNKEERMEDAYGYHRLAMTCGSLGARVDTQENPPPSTPQTGLRSPMFFISHKDLVHYCLLH